MRAALPGVCAAKDMAGITHYTIRDRHVIKVRTPVRICGITFEAFPVEYSILSPAVGIG